MGKGFIGSSRIIHILCSSFLLGSPAPFVRVPPFVFLYGPIVPSQAHFHNKHNCPADEHFINRAVLAEILAFRRF